MLKKIVFIFVLTSISMSIQAINYSISFPKVKAHYVTVEVMFNAVNKEYVDFKVPVWTPGSYKIREFSNAIENVNAAELKIDRVDKNTWRIHTNGQKNVKLTYDVYCFTISVRQSYVDEFYGFLHGVSVFGYLEGYENEPIDLIIYPNKTWANVEVSLPKTNLSMHSFSCENYDLLADSPIALGNFDITSYTSGNVLHKIVMIGKGNYNLDEIQQDFKKISDWQVAIMGDHPSPQYIHFIYNVAQGGGGLEHLNSQTSMMSRWNYTNPNAYRNFLGLIAHEYFHLWNVKRIRPIELGPFDYNHEVYTDMLWIAEGITSYYDDLTLLSIGKYSQDEYLNIIASQINRMENSPGKSMMSLAHSSLLTWVKAYLPNEESSNTNISYYNKGMITALLLDLEIRKSSDKSLDDVMRMLYIDFYKNKNRGFYFDEFIKVSSLIAGKDMTNFFKTLVYSTNPIDYQIFSHFGLELSLINKDEKSPWCGVTSQLKDGQILITNIVSGSPAMEAGLSVNDEIISINNWRLTDKMETYISKFDVNEHIELIYARDLKIHKEPLKLVQDPTLEYILTVDDDKNVFLKQWLK